MKIIRFLGGLGNQMFQYAFYKALQYRFRNVKADLTGFSDYTLHNGFELERIFPIRLHSASNFEINLLDSRNREWKYRKLRKLLFINAGYFEELDLFNYNEAILKDNSSKIYWGYWQHHRYFDEVTDELLADFKFNEPEDLKNKTLLQEINANEESVAIHVRRGDYLKDPYLGGLVDVEYFEKGIALVRERLRNPKFYVFSDDITWCKQYLNLQESVFIDWNKGNDSYRDMQLMSHCKHAIISNSSFSWWGAWLNRSPNKVIVVPKVWYRSSNVLDTSKMHPRIWIKI
ncbi:alpha-1,2-fucosyltransferase [Olivibacter domesticus]|uniref:alpha-1,2-fucosyltransferase n=1 Tax=Olivibacter domesticus TaxID=407022 RepID=UPI00360B4B36